MAVIRAFDKPFDVVDYTQELVTIPNTWGLINELGIFRNEPVSNHSITVEMRAGTLAAITDQTRGARNLVNKDDGRSIRGFAIPHFPLDDAVMPQDIQGKRAYGSPDAAETKDAVVARKLARIRMNHAITLETARAYALTSGAIYAPNGTVSGNYFTEFGVTQTTVDFVLGTSTTEVVNKVETAISAIQDNILTGEVVNNVIVLCSNGFFNKLITHANVKDAFRYYTSTQEPLRQRLGSGLYRRFEYAGATFIEYRGSYNGSLLIPAGDAYMIPVGTQDTFVSYFSPANKFSHVNTLGEEVYAFAYQDQKDEHIQLQTESNHLHLVRRPGCVIRLFSSN